MKELKIKTSLREKSTKEQSGSYVTTTQHAHPLLNEKEEGFPVEAVSPAQDQIQFGKQYSSRSI